MEIEVKINQEIKEYNETMFFGLSVRQFFFSLLACGVAVWIYFGCRSFLDAETLSWLCMLGAAPFAAMGFFHYHGMTAEQFALNWIRTVLVEPQCFPFRSYTPHIKKPHRKEIAHVESTEAVQQAAEAEV